ncbi:MAG: hypothetical protein EBU90_26415 [Proteobacteria bacterium]|nr:hypothetical protein [Pseudomonadota bacterium]
MRSDTQLTADYMEKKFTQSLLKKLKSLKTLTDAQAKTIIAELLLKVLRLESDHRANYDKNPYDY